ncbi:ABC transporter ATP-binding protein [Calothrix sp. FACHB-156]|nr:ABC transporter ATP-binding protein [Nostoc linckia FACHB-104]MBD2338266.1 ABC transporter ATP-binding protein [Calothrix sp. FACHB-156]
MHELLNLFHRMLVKTKFWQEHYLILQLFQPLRLTAAIAVLFTLIGAVLEATGIGLVAVLLQGLTNANQPPLQSGIAWFDIWFLGTQASASERIYRISGLILFNVWLRGLFSYLGRYYAKFCEVNLIDSLRKKIFEQFQNLSLSYYTQKRSGELFQTFSSEVSEISYAFNEVINFVSKSCIILAYTLAMFVISWQLTLATVFLFSLLAAGAANLIKRVRAASVEMTAAGSELASTAVEFVGGVRTVQAFWTQDFERRRFYKVAGQVTKAWMKTTSISAMVQPLIEAMATTILIAMILVAVTTLVASGKLHVVLLLAFLFALFRLLPIIAHMNSSWGIIATYYGSLRSVNELLRTDNKTYQEDGELEFSGLKQAIAFTCVDFSYDDHKLVLEDITLTIKRNQMLALVGSSGSGKTTLADLLMRFYDPTRGKILIDGIDLRQFRLQSLRSRMAVVSQDTFIFNTTVQNNIAYGLEGVDESEIEEVARQANALEFILELPQGFQTKLGDRGVRLSGGQRQRIAIARALLRNPEILILDEATSALDSVSERLIQDSLEKLAVGRTVIAIAHRLSTIFRADKIVVLEQGHIIEQGGYQELLQQRGKFWQYHQMQYELGRG